MMPIPDFQTRAVQDAFANFPDDIRPHLLELRAEILSMADDLPGVGPVQETLKWGQPSYLTPATNAGTTIRLATTKAGGYGIFTHCQTTVMSDFQHIAPAGFTFDGNRGVLFDPDTPPDMDALRPLIRAALTYHL